MKYHLKYVLYYMYGTIALHEISFIGNKDALPPTTYGERERESGKNGFINYVYPLRLICKKFDKIIVNKIVKSYSDKTPRLTVNP